MGDLTTNRQCRTQTRPHSDRHHLERKDLRDPLTQCCDAQNGDRRRQELCRSQAAQKNKGKDKEGQNTVEKLQSEASWKKESSSKKKSWADICEENDHRQSSTQERRTIGGCESIDAEENSTIRSSEEMINSSPAFWQHADGVQKDYVVNSHPPVQNSDSDRSSDTFPAENSDAYSVDLSDDGVLQVSQKDSEVNGSVDEFGDDLTSPDETGLYHCGHDGEQQEGENLDANQRFHVLCYEQVRRLDEVMETPMPVHGRGNFPTLEIRLRKLVQLVRDRLISDGVRVKDVRINGGAASYILCCGNGGQQPYNDLDLIFGVDLSGSFSADAQRDLQRAKEAVFSSLLEFLPEGVNRQKMCGGNLREAYVHKMVKIFNETDRWSLISLSNVNGRNVELKFADTIRRQFEFSVDSFQIVLDGLLTFYTVSTAPMSKHFFPTVLAESVFGDFNAALDHLERRLIATRNPEQIRGGGLLKYCHLLARGYKPAADVNIKQLEKYMCSRFFIDFSDIEEQRVKLENYLANHFNTGCSGDGTTPKFFGEGDTGADSDTAADEDLHQKYEYLLVLYAVVNKSTVCLMGHERRQALTLIQTLACRVLLLAQQRAFSRHMCRVISTRHQPPVIPIPWSVQPPPTTFNHQQPTANVAQPSSSEQQIFLPVPEDPRSPYTTPPYPSHSPPTCEYLDGVVKKFTDYPPAYHSPCQPPPTSVSFVYALPSTTATACTQSSHPGSSHPGSYCVTCLQCV